MVFMMKMKKKAVGMKTKRVCRFSKMRLRRMTLTKILRTNMEKRKKLGQFYDLADSVSPLEVGGKDFECLNITMVLSQPLPKLSLTLTKKRYLDLTKTFGKRASPRKFRPKTVQHVEDCSAVCSERLKGSHYKMGVCRETRGR